MGRKSIAAFSETILTTFSYTSRGNSVQILFRIHLKKNDFQEVARQNNVPKQVTALGYDGLSSCFVACRSFFGMLHSKLPLDFSSLGSRQSFVDRKLCTIVFLFTVIVSIRLPFPDWFRVDAQNGLLFVLLRINFSSSTQNKKVFKTVFR